MRGKRAVEWRLVDELVPPSAWEATVRQRAQAMADRPPATGIRLTPLQREITADALSYPHVGVALDRRKLLELKRELRNHTRSAMAPATAESI